MYNVINMSCAEIESAVGFLYVIQSVIMNQTLSVGCEQSWYTQVSVFLSIIHSHIYWYPYHYGLIS